MVLPVLAIMGPTASGKSAIALALAARMDAEIISVDSAQVYRGMDRGTAKPTAEERVRVPHHLIDLFEPEQAYSAGAFRRDALRLIDDVHARGRTPLLVGGTMLYFDALMHGIAELPPADPALRAAIDAQAAKIGWPAMHARLSKLDPAAAEKIQPSDRQRIQRALELNRLTGRSLDELRSAPREAAPAIAAFALFPTDRSALHDRIGRRLDAMFADGFVEEVRELHQRPGLTAESPSMRAVGYRQIWSYLDGQWDLAGARERAAAATRNLSKRQITWLKRFPEAGRIEIADGDDPESLADLMLAQSGWAHRCDGVVGAPSRGAIWLGRGAEHRSNGGAVPLPFLARGLGLGAWGIPQCYHYRSQCGSSPGMPIPTKRDSSCPRLSPCRIRS